MGGRRAPLRCGGRRCAPTPLRCSGRGRAAELTTFAALSSFKQAAASQTTKRAARADPDPGLAGRAGPHGPAVRKAQTVPRTVCVPAHLLVAAEALRPPPAHGFAGSNVSLGRKARCGHRARTAPRRARRGARGESQARCLRFAFLSQRAAGAARLRVGRPGSGFAAPSSAVERGEVCRLGGRPARSLYGPARSGPEPEASQPPSRSEQRRASVDEQESTVDSCSPHERAGLASPALARAAIGADWAARPQPCSPARHKVCSCGLT